MEEGQPEGVASVSHQVQATVLGKILMELHDHHHLGRNQENLEIQGWLLQHTCEKKPEKKTIWFNMCDWVGIAVIVSANFGGKWCFPTPPTTQLCGFHTDDGRTGVGQESKGYSGRNHQVENILGKLWWTQKKHRVKYPWSLREVASLPVKWQVYPWSTREVGTPKILNFWWWFFGWPIPHVGECFWSVLAPLSFWEQLARKRKKGIPIVLDLFQ